MTSFSRDFSCHIKVYHMAANVGSGTLVPMSIVLFHALHSPGNAYTVHASRCVRILCYMLSLDFHMYLLS